MSQAGGSSAEDTPSSAPQAESRAWTPVGTLAQKEGPCAGVSSLMESPKEAAKQQTENVTGFQASRFGEKNQSLIEKRTCEQKHQPHSLHFCC